MAAAERSSLGTARSGAFWPTVKPGSAHPAAPAGAPSSSGSPPTTRSRRWWWEAASSAWRCAGVLGACGWLAGSPACCWLPSAAHPLPALHAPHPRRPLHCHTDGGEPGAPGPQDVDRGDAAAGARRSRPRHGRPSRRRLLAHHGPPGQPHGASSAGPRLTVLSLPRPCSIARRSCLPLIPRWLSPCTRTCAPRCLEVLGWTCRLRCSGHTPALARPARRLCTAVARHALAHPPRAPPACLPHHPRPGRAWTCTWATAWRALRRGRAARASW